MDEINTLNVVLRIIGHISIVFAYVAREHLEDRKNGLSRNESSDRVRKHISVGIAAVAGLSLIIGTYLL